ncbi:hypothetical protein [Rhodohalobacter sp.]|uniref:hypothetical protein n=1 Tax=Rhodohalobacter sp. TaxID=1974210 RepID=UPI002ACE357B|nr:hypothetical protein [Rhodohalobacter sp.]MDZ7758083.1 hypothetical protein [Rhodohalobacter sp.]
MEDGKISFSKLHKLQQKLTALAEGAVLNLVEGRSKPGSGQKPKWLRDVLNFQLSGLEKGSTVLKVEAPEIGHIYKDKQLGFFDDPEAELLLKESAFGLAGYVINKAVYEPESTSFLDKYLLKQITEFYKILDNENSEINLISKGRIKMKSVSIKKETLDKVSITEEKTRESVKTAVSGTIDVLRNRKEQLEILTDEAKMYRAFPGSNLNIKNLKSFFGEKVKVTGMAHFKTDGNLKYIEILDIQSVGAEDRVAEEFTLPIFEDIDLKRLAKEQDWHGFNKKKFKQEIKDMKIEESLEEMLELLKE